MRAISQTKDSEAMFKFTYRPRLMFGASIFLTGLSLLMVETISSLSQ